MGKFTQVILYWRRFSIGEYNVLVHGFPEYERLK